MPSWSKAVGLGVVMWLIPFVVAFMIFPLHETRRPLFESVMAVTVAATAVGLGLFWLRAVVRPSPALGLQAGLLWLAVCIAVDAPLMLVGGPMKMTLSAYLADIGVTYLMIPVVTVGLAMAKQQALVEPKAHHVL